jgi:phosphate starvation-inducible PhoH-like protein
VILTPNSDSPSPTRVTCSPEHLPALVGPHDQNLRVIEDALSVHLLPRDECVEISGEAQAAAQAQAVLGHLLAGIHRGQEPTLEEVHLALRQARGSGLPSPQEAGDLEGPLIVTHRGRQVRAKTRGQIEYVRAVRDHDLVFCAGPAGTGKTYLAMALAAAALRQGETSRIILTRPIVEAGEELGFLPGDIMEKVDPYLRPLHDALHDVMGADQFQRYLARGTIEVVPLAYMRGRTLNDAFIVLDEAQNTTPGQMKMALTRMGFGSKMIVTGDTTQTDLPAAIKSGLVHAIEVLGGLPGLAVVRLGREDIVRHDLVQRIVQAYESAERAGRESRPVQE